MATSHETNRPVVFTIGHSNQSLDSFVSLLMQHHIALLVDTRSVPLSRAAPQFNKPNLRSALEAAGVLYVHKGKALGGRPRSEHFYDNEGHVRYNLVAETALFQAAISSIERGAKRESRMALMCAEEDPLHCHRRLLVGRVLLHRGIAIEHIRRNGLVLSEEDLAKRFDDPTYHQVTMFSPGGDTEWRSTQSVLPRRPPRTSSNA